MTEWLISIEGTQTGHQVALYLAILAAFLHAVFGALQKGRHDPWLTRGAIDFSYGIMAAPFALFVVPWPEPHMWPIFAIVWVIHVIYKLLQAWAYTKGAYTVVLPRCAWHQVHCSQSSAHILSFPKASHLYNGWVLPP